MPSPSNPKLIALQVWVLLLLGIAFSSTACVGHMAPESAPTAAKPSSDCADGYRIDDGSAENGYGFMPSSKWATYLQEFDSSKLPGRQVDRVCVCFLRTREATEMDFEVVFHRQQVNRPGLETYAAVGSRATDIPEGVESGGKFYSVDISDVVLPEGKSYIGVRFDPSEGRFVFLCSDRSEETALTPGFQMDDRSKDWTDVLTTRDSTFRNHRAALIRLDASPAPETAASEAAAPGSAAPETGDTEGAND